MQKPVEVKKKCKSHLLSEFPSQGLTIAFLNQEQIHG
jgi:hypothetical protein